MNDRGSVLVVDDDRAMCEMLEETLANRGFRVRAQTEANGVVDALLEGPTDVLLTDLSLRGASGLDLCRRVVDRFPNLPVVMITAYGNLQTAVGAIRAGAYDFVTKPFDVDVLALVLDRAVAHHGLRREVQRLTDAVAAPPPASAILGESRAIRMVRDFIERVASSDATVLVTGESGTGKELAARALHDRNPTRASKPFVAVNCSAIPEALLESELFGHTKGAFTDAQRARTGLFVRAQGGTLFLDEVGDLPLSLQPKLLRALEERRVRPVGSDDDVPFDVRLVCATHVDLDAAVQEGRFRRDLQFRIQVIELAIPPLRARGADVLLLAQHFLQSMTDASHTEPRRLSPAVAARMLAYPWPGNVRELRNALVRAVALARTPEIVPDDLPERIRDASAAPVAGGAPELATLDEMERRHVMQVLDSVGGNKKLAAQVLGLDRSTLYRKLERWSLFPGDGNAS